eukprot:g4229.t1
MQIDIQQTTKTLKKKKYMLQGATKNTPAARRRAKKASRIKAKNDEREKQFALGVRLVDNKIPKRRRPKTASATLSSSSLNTSSIHSYKSSSTNRSRSTYNNNGNSESNNQQIRAFNITYQDGPMQDEDHGEDDVELLKHVLYREQCITDLRSLSKAFKKIHPAVNAKSTQILAKMIEIIEGMRTASLIIVEGIWHWRYKRIVSLLHRRRLPAPGIQHKPYPFVYDGDNYLLKMAFDLTFLDDLPPLVEWLGAHFHRNTFCIKAEDTLDSINATPILDNGETVEAAAQNAPLPSDAAYIDRLRWASSVILAEESMRGRFVSKKMEELKQPSSQIIESSSKNLHPSNDNMTKNMKVVNDIDATLNSVKNKKLLAGFEEKREENSYNNEIINMKEEIERRRRRRGEKVDSLFYKNKSGGENPSGSHRLMKMLKKNKSLREELKALQKELNILSVETEALEAAENEQIEKEKELGPDQGDGRQQTNSPTSGGNSEQYFQNFKRNF